MKSSKGFVQGYNAQVSVTEEQLIIAAELTQEENDQKQLAPMIRASQENTKFAAESVTAALADTGYYNEEEIESLSEDSPELYLATKKDRKQRSDCVSKSHLKGAFLEPLRERKDGTKASYQKGKGDVFKERMDGRRYLWSDEARSWF